MLFPGTDSPLLNFLGKMDKYLRPQVEYLVTLAIFCFHYIDPFITCLTVSFNTVSSNWVIVAHENLKKPPKRRLRDFFHAICLRRCPMARTALKHEHMASKFNPNVKIRKNYSATITFSKSYLLRISFQLLRINFSDCTSQMCAIIENHIAHDLLIYCALILCICIRKKLE